MFAIKKYLYFHGLGPKADFSPQMYLITRPEYNNRLITIQGLFNFSEVGVGGGGRLKLEAGKIYISDFSNPDTLFLMRINHTYKKLTARNCI